MKWILIYFVFGLPTNFVSTTGNVVFDDQAACQAALQQIEDKFKGPYANSYGICAQSMTPPPVVPAPGVGALPPYQFGQ